MCNIFVISKEISKENNGSVDGYIEMLNSMAAFYSAAGSIWKAVEIGENVADTILTNYGKNDSYANSLNNLALYYANAGDYEKFYALDYLSGIELGNYVNSISFSIKISICK